MRKFVCAICGYAYDVVEGDPDNGIEPETEFMEIPSDWICPLCGASKEDFIETEVEEEDI